MKILWGAKFLAAPFLRMFFLKCFAAGGQDWLFVAAFEMLCGCAGYQDSLRASCSRLRG